MSERCPICRAAVARRADNPAYPFCSPRCRAIDLGRWLGDEYRIASDEPPDEPDGDERSGSAD